VYFHFWNSEYLYFLHTASAFMLKGDCPP
jgi:hypothetical protein